MAKKKAAAKPAAKNKGRPSRTADSMTPSQYERHKDRAAKVQREKSVAGRDIGPIDDIINPGRRESCRLDLRHYLLTYHKEQFGHAFSPDHEKVIQKTQQAVIQGGLFALAMPRGSGKTTICECACLWALLYGHRQFVTLIGADEEHAMSMLESLKVELETSDILREDFPEVCQPIAELEGIANRCKGQLCEGERTRITWTKKAVVLPTIKGSVASGAVIKVRGITGRIRGMKHKLADGRSIRPSLVILDDPQTDESAASETQNRQRIGILNGAILKLAGPGQRIAGVMPCTVIKPGDMADVILNPERSPQWNGERCKLLYQFPDRMDLWEQYGEMVRDDFRSGDSDHAAATAFYSEHRAEMDAGALVGWEARFEPHQLSALQFAMTEFLLNPAVFAAEFQNEPEPDEITFDMRLTANEITLKQHAQARCIVPLAAHLVTASIDVQQRVLYWSVCAWDRFGCGYVLDYGTFPEQSQRHITYRKATSTLGRKYPGKGEEAALRMGLEHLLTDLQGRRFKREDGLELSPELTMVDCSYKSDVIRRTVRELRRHDVRPAFGRFYGAKTKPLEETAKPGDIPGEGWVDRYDRQHLVRTVTFDTNHWKAWVDARFSVSIGDPGSLSLYRAQPAHHDTFAAHCRAEPRDLITSELTGRQCWEYQEPVAGRDNHWWDTLIGNALAGNMKGVRLTDGASMEKPSKTTVSVAEKQKARLQGQPPPMPPEPPAVTPVGTPVAEQPRKLSVAERQALRLGARR